VEVVDNAELQLAELSALIVGQRCRYVEASLIEPIEPLLVAQPFAVVSANLLR